MLPMSCTMTVYLGCYTDSAHPNGLKALCVDETAGRMEVVAECPVSNALYQALSLDGAVLYSCTGEGLASFRADDARFDRIDDVKLGSCVCHVAAMPDGKRVVFADYLGGFAGSVAVEDGKFGEVVTHRHSGSGPNLPRQDKAHCHQAMPTPDGNGYCVADLGLDQIVEYPSGRVFRTSPSGAGPRHLLFHPDGRLVFLLYELGNLVSSFSWDSSLGFRLIDTIPTIENSCPLSQAAAIRFTPDMKRIVVSNRGEDSLVVYDFDSATGRLEFKARSFLAGSWPRDFMFVSDNVALVALERSGEVHMLRYDVATGGFETVANLGGLFRPVALCKRVDQ